MINVLTDDLKVLQGYAVQFRYPGQKATKEDAYEAFRIAINIRAFIRRQLGFPQ